MEKKALNVVHSFPSGKTLTHEVIMKTPYEIDTIKNEVAVENLIRLVVDNRYDKKKKAVQDSKFRHDIDKKLIDKAKAEGLY